MGTRSHSIQAMYGVLSPYDSYLMVLIEQVETQGCVECTRTRDESPVPPTVVWRVSRDLVTARMWLSLIYQLNLVFIRDFNAHKASSYRVAGMRRTRPALRGFHERNALNSFCLQKLRLIGLRPLSYGTLDTRFRHLATTC